MQGHWIPGLVALAGGDEVWGKPGEFSSGLEFSSLTSASPDVIILMPCGFDVTRTCREARDILPRAVPGWSSIPAVKSGCVWAVHGNRLYSGASPAMVEGLEVLATILHGSIEEQAALDPVMSATKVDFS